MEIIKQAETEGLVLQPRNLQDIVNICCCCGDCCQVLLHLKKHPKTALAVSSPFRAEHDASLCVGCGACVDRCPMEAHTMADGLGGLNRDRCIGCGLCVSICTGGALILLRKPPELQPVVPKNQRDAFMMRTQARAAARNEMEDKLKRHHRL